MQINNNKSGFLAPVNGSDNATTVFYQCKSCLSFLASTVKWDRHLSKCLSKHADAGSNGVAFRPVGFRMISFAQPKLLLERIKPKAEVVRTTTTGENTQYCRDNLQTFPSAGGAGVRKRGRPRKIIYSGTESECVEAEKLNSSPPKSFLENEPLKLVRKRGRPRKIIYSGTESECMEAEKSNVSPPKSVLDNESLKFVRKRGRPRKVIPAETRHNEKEQVDIPESCVESDMPKPIIRKRGRPKKKQIVQEPLDETIDSEPADSENFPRKSNRPKKECIYLEPSIDESSQSSRKSFKFKKRTDKGKNPTRKTASTFFKAARRQKKCDEENVVRNYKFSCPICPGKFQIVRDLNIHINGVHNGTRRLMYCCVCGRVFNKRDSLNQHYLSHEAAEAREETFNLFQPWNDATLEKVKKYRSHFLARQQTCKACLLHHYTYHSFVTHFRQEHSDPPEAYTLDCKFENCQLQFKSIRILLEHAKAEHPDKFFGSLTRKRQERGVFIGNRVVPRDEKGNLLYKLRTIPPKPRKKKLYAQHHEKRVSSFTPLQSNDDNGEGSDWEKEVGISPPRQLEDFVKNTDESDIDENESIPPVKAIEIERVHVNDNFLVKREGCVFTENIKLETKEEHIIPHINDDDDNSSQSPLSLESVPVAFGIVKGELIDL